ncbi:exported hypothetical protein [Nitrosotalea sinensis]|jgi:soluble cytochrome b562|uniref:DUF5667 domain-containing protein n=1 Tax=Nitrosotalea sinensis TaxID=1499975 RepID=A0A2H1EES3_9ARCH|nr:hypothetical protein [Candidatus Nitrosotalea sinensis]SHO43390.1 exported hypothetical protein [Candidatus Nitrosotalea sinensis]
MKSLSIVIATLVATLVLNGPIQSYADPQLDTLVNIATQAKNNLNIRISQISNVSTEITSLYQQGSDETDALTRATDVQNITSAKQHFLSAMNFFKQTNDKINSINATEVNDQQRVDVAKLQSEITRLTKIAETLRTISITNHAGFDFTPFDASIQQAKQALDAGKIDEASKSIDAANQLIVNAHHALSEIAQERTTDRAKDFTEKQIERFDKINELNTTQNYSPLVSNTTVSTTNNNQTSIPENTNEMIAKLRKLVSEGNVDEALKIIKSLDKYQNDTTTQNNENTEQKYQTITVLNNTNSSSNLQSATQSNVPGGLTNVTNSIENSSNNISNQTNENDKINRNSYNNDTSEINKNKKIEKTEHQTRFDTNEQNNTDSNLTSSNFTSIHDIQTNSSNNRQIHEDHIINRTTLQETPHGNVDSQQHNSVHERNNNSEQRGKPTHEKNDH